MTFNFQPSHHVPFRDLEAVDRCRRITRDQIERHPNPDFCIRVLPVSEIESIWVTDLFYRIKRSDETNEPVTLILPNPCSAIYRQVARLINRFEVDCRNVHLFAMDEYANQDGEVAPDDWPYGLVHAMLDGLYRAIDSHLRPPREQVVGPTTKNLPDYGKMIADRGGADMVYTGPGWTGHLAFIEPDAPELDMPWEQWIEQGPLICTLSPFTIAQNSLHGSFGLSGDLAAIPPKGATIGPAEIVGAKNRIELAAFTVHGTATAWQRMIARLCYHGPVTPRLPSSLHQTLRTDCYISELIAQDIEPDWGKGY